MYLKESGEVTVGGVFSREEDEGLKVDIKLPAADL